MITNKDLSIDSKNGKVTLNGNKYDLGTQGEIDAAVKDVYSVMGQNGAKNLIPYPYYTESGYSNQGMTITYDADGVFTINKVAGTATAYFRIATLNFLKPSTKYRLVFEVENATSISIFLQKPTTGDYVTINNKSSGIFVAEFETTADSQISSRSIGLSCTASDTETNATVKVMLVYASDIDNTYQPYAKTNRQLTEAIGDLSQTDITGASVAEQLGVLGEILGFTHFIRIPFTTGVLESIEAAFENGTIPADIMGLTIGTLRGQAGTQRVIFIAQNQSDTSTTQTRYAAIYFGAYTAPRFCQKQDGSAWTDVAL